MALSKTLCDLDSVPTRLESIRVRCQSPSENKFLLQAEKWATKATQALEQLAVHYEDEENDKEPYREPGVFRCLRLLETHLGLLMKYVNLQNLFFQALSSPEITELLIPFVDPSANDNVAIQVSSEYNSVAVVESLLAARDDSGRLRVDPAACDNAAIRLSSQFGHVAVVALLLAARDDSGRLRVDPSALDNAAIQAASFNGHVAVVERLLRDSRVDPSARNNEALRLASSYGHKEIVALLKPRSKLTFLQKLWY